MDKITLNFETCDVIFERDGQYSSVFFPDLRVRRARILEAIGAEELDLGPLIDLTNQFINGEITEDEFKDRGEKWAGED